jgi:PhnB protein
LYVYVADVEATHARALALGARQLEAPLDTPYGDRRSMIEDTWGNTWQIARPLDSGI